MRYGSVCSGIEAATVAWHPLGWEPAFFAEIDKFPSAVLRHHYPDVPNHGDFTTIKGDEYGAIDVLVGGTPCQSFSIAGKRLGLDDPRGNLTLEFLALVKRIQPRYVVWENVPGFLSDDGGNTARQFLDTLEDLGYVVDIDILDAQYYGVPQRRRRVFVCGQSVKTILKQKTTSSVLTTAQCIVEILHLALDEKLNPSATEPANSRLAGLSKNGLKRRMKLFDLQSEDRLQMLRENWVGTLQNYVNNVEGSVSRGERETESSHAKEDLWLDFTLTEAGKGFVRWNTAGSWKELWGGFSQVMKSSTILMESSPITNHTIYIFSQAVLNISGLMLLLNRSSPSYLGAVSSILIALEAYTDYARSTISDLFADVEWVQSWGDFIGQAEHQIQVIRHIREECSAEEVLSKRKGMRGYSKESREARETAPTIPSRRTAGGGLGTDFDCDGGLVESSVSASTGDVAHCLNAGGMGRQDYETETLITHALRGEGFDASEDGTGRGTPLIPVISNTLTSHRGDGGGGLDPSETLIPVASFNETGAGYWNESAIAATVRKGNEQGHGSARESTVVAYRTNAAGQIMGQGDIAAAVTTMTDPTTQFIAFTCNDSGSDAGDISPTLRSMGHNTSHANAGGQVAVAMHTFQKTVRSGARDANGELPPEKWEPREIAATLNGFDQGDKRAVDLVVQAFTQNQEGDVLTGDVMHSLGTNSNATGRNATNVAISFEPRYYAEGRMRPGGAPSETVATLKHSPKSGDTSPHIASGMAVRRLTPVECERLQNFPDNYTKISDKSADGPRYKALGNSMCTSVMRWIGERIQMVDAL